MNRPLDGHTTLSVVVPCFNEESTLERCVQRLLQIQDATLSLEVIIVDDCSTDRSLVVAQSLADRHLEVIVMHHQRNKGKGAALRSGFEVAKGEFVAVQDADLEYDPRDLRKLLDPLVEGAADVVLGSRFSTDGVRRVLYFWHSMGNKFLTFLSNMFTDLNLTDMETCYKVFRKEAIRSIEIEEDRFGFEPEIIAKVAQRRLRIYETGISYHGRTYEEGKKITMKDGFRALYCILRYNAPMLPLPVKFVLRQLIGVVAALANLATFLILLSWNFTALISASIAFALAASFNYFLITALLFRNKVRPGSLTKQVSYGAAVCLTGILDVYSTSFLMLSGSSPWIAKSIALGLVVIANSLILRYLDFPQGDSEDVPQFA